MRFEVLARCAHQVVAANPGKAAPLVREGIVLSSEAGAEGGLGALSLAKAARKDLEQALELNGKALGGSACTSLGTLYYKLPGWPISFGDNDKAQKLLRRALAVNPTGIDPNYFYADFLLERSRPREALKYLQTVLKAPPRPGRALADSGRREQVLALIAKAEKDLGSDASLSASR